MRESFKYEGPRSSAKAPIFWEAFCLERRLQKLDRVLASHLHDLAGQQEMDLRPAR